MIEFERIITTLTAVVAAQIAPATQIAPVAPTAAPTTEVAVPAACDRTGRADVTDCLNRFFTGLSNDSTVRFPAGARYRIEGTVTMGDKSRVEVDGQGATLFSTTRGDRGRAHFALTRDTDVTVRDLVIRGSNPTAGPDGKYDADLEAQHGVRVLGSQRVQLTALDIDDVWGDGIYVARSLTRDEAAARHSTDITILKNTLRGSGRQGIGVSQGVHRLRIEDNVLSGARRSTIDLEPPWVGQAKGGGVSEVLIKGNTVSPGRFNFIAAAGGGSVNQVWVLDNRGVGKTLSIVVRDRHNYGRANWLIEGNVSDRKYSSAKDGVVVAKGVEGIVYRNNTQPVDPGRGIAGLVALEGTCGAVSAANDLDGAPQLGGRSGKCPKAPLTRSPLLPAQVLAPSVSGSAR